LKNKIIWTFFFFLSTHLPLLTEYMDFLEYIQQTQRKIIFDRHTVLLKRIQLRSRTFADVASNIMSHNTLSSVACYKTMFSGAFSGAMWVPGSGPPSSKAKKKSSHESLVTKVQRKRTIIYIVRLRITLNPHLNR
jgi:hypothetical protein